MRKKNWEKYADIDDQIKWNCYYYHGDDSDLQVDEMLKVIKKYFSWKNDDENEMMMLLMLVMVIRSW